MNIAMKAIRLAKQDNVATLLGDADKHQLVGVIDEMNQPAGEFEARQRIPFGNKIALGRIGPGEVITKAGYPVGVAIKEIPAGELVHVQNVRSSRVDIPENIIEQIIHQMQIETE